MSSSVYLPKIVLCIPGHWESREEVRALLDASKVEFEFQGPDARMESAFRSARSRWRPCLSDSDCQAIRRHSSVLYVLSRNFPAGEAAQCSHHLMRIGSGLLELGGIAVKCESSGKSHSAKHWTELARDADAGYKASLEAGADDDTKMAGRLVFWDALFEAYVAFPISDDRDLYSCGLHLLGMPDLIASTEVLEHAFAGDPNQRAVEAACLLNVFALYVRAECPQGAFRSGDTFRSTDTSPRFRVTKEPCTGYDEDDFFFNPHGRWRFGRDS